MAVVSAAAARDDAGAVNVEYVVLQARDQQLIERARARGDGAEEVIISAFLPHEELTTRERERLCFAMHARDPYGHETTPDHEACAETPEHSPFGNACAAPTKNFQRVV